MEQLYLALIALVQGLTEFLPISSSAHLVLLSELLGGVDQGLSFDIAVHFGTLLALCWYLRSDLMHLCRAFMPSSPEAQSARRLWLLLAIGTLPLAVAGALLRPLVEEGLRHVSVIAAANLFFAALLWRAWQRRLAFASEQQLSELSRRQALVTGCLQAFAVIPGASRSGLTLTGGLISGLSPETALRFSFLLAIPALGGAFVLELWYWQTLSAVHWWEAAAGAAVAGAVAFAVLRSLTAWVARVGLLPFVIYRLVLGAVLLILFVRPSM